MKMILIDSTTMKAIGYSKTLKKLRIVFNKNEVYDYEAVPPELFSGLLNADSKGRFFNFFIKDKGFHYEKI